MNSITATHVVLQNAQLPLLLIKQNRLTRAITRAHEVFIRERRLRATEMALDGLPDDIRCDIGWPDLYERQVSEFNKLKFRR
ncbi:hypothetical protein N8E89_01250 [Phyllobacterium sp. A18/5-2]|uniref:hypothetical protein n=1 Tax=Phyllobacterium sp. A18/5-2 TaxID=2978392 RepID=UPI0021C88010|nr:hypothetical protein [Phyllobacterium sp. A18/5-2]UXN64527.1 hypothetical protein N8E89_01250 [Phyllobacterium sp. A18/5-2]